jgi:hypothetical protein
MVVLQPYRQLVINHPVQGLWGRLVGSGRAEWDLMDFLIDGRNTNDWYRIRTLRCFGDLHI